MSTTLNNTESDTINVSEESDLSEYWLDIKDEFGGDILPTQEAELIESFISEIVQLELAGESVRNKDGWFETVAQNTTSNKTSIKNTYDSIKTELEKEQGDEKEHSYELDKIVEQHVSQLVVLKSSDSNHDTTYQWYFDDEFSTDVVETKQEWKNPGNFKEILFSALDVMVYGPSFQDKEWPDYIKRWVIQNQKVEQTTGTRTIAIQDLKNQVSKTVAYTHEEAAARNGVLYVEDEEFDAIQVPNELTNTVCDEHNITPQALHAELRSTGYLERKARQEEIDGVTMRWWQLTTDFVSEIEIDEVPPGLISSETVDMAGDSDE
ncbi:hypothetical protein [Halosimplex halobium]|uniref:hypothetical protein n=1 Tax=Halosimplex halobium TaxID=3396618 RepID=UPI003F5613EE